MERNLALEFVRVTEAAAIGSSKWLGKGDKHRADEAAVKEMRERFANVEFNGKVVIGEGERDEAPMLFIGERIGTGAGPEMDIAVDPLECTNSVAFGRPNAISVLAAAPKGSLLGAPDTYMDKIAAGPEAKDAIDLDAPVRDNIRAVADALGKEPQEVTVMVLERDRHQKLIQKIRDSGARILLIPDGDIAGAVAPSLPESGVDMLLGIGAAPEGVIAAAAIKCLGGGFQGRLQLRNEKEEERARQMGLSDLKRKLHLEDLAKGPHCIFAATGVTDGPMLRGVQFRRNGIITHSIVMRAKSRTVRFLQTFHHIGGSHDENTRPG